MIDIFSGLITSKIRIRILMRLFLNPDQKPYLRELAKDLDASPSHIKAELNQLEDANLLTSQKSGRNLLFQANTDHPVFNELQSMVKKALGMNQILDSIIYRLGNLERAILLDDYAIGKDTGIIDLLLVGNIDLDNLQDLTKKTENYIDRKIRTLILTKSEYISMTSRLDNRPQLLLWEQS